LNLKPEAENPKPWSPEPYTPDTTERTSCRRARGSSPTPRSGPETPRCRGWKPWRWRTRDAAWTEDALWMIISPHVANIGTPPQISERGSAPSCAGPLLFSSLHP